MTLLFHVSDIHFGAHDSKALSWFESQVARERPDAIVVTGDLTYRARSREFDAAAQWLGRLGSPLVIGPGNHDLPYFNMLERLTDPYRRYQAMTASSLRPLDLPDVTIIALDTTAQFQWRLNWAEGRVSRKRLAQAVAAIVAAPAGHQVLVACHHPLAHADLLTKSQTKRGQLALDSLAAAGVRAVLSGHVHDPFDVERRIGGRPVRLIGAGTLSQRLRRSSPSFNTIRVDRQRLDVTLVTMG